VVTNVCKDCGSPFTERQKRCPCGWVNLGTSHQANNDERCHYRLGNRRCPLPGVIDSGVLLCPYHWDQQNDAKAAEAVLLWIEKNYDSIYISFIEERKDWRIKLWEQIEKK
jgi:hypothetical protein